MIVDSHCHAWTYWPYQPPVPDPTSRSLVEQLLWEMDRNGVDRAVIVSARIDHNPENNEYGAECVARYPDRLYQFADVDCQWWPTYHTAGAAERLRQAIDRYHLRGFTHYIRREDDGAWFDSADGRAFLRVAADLHQIASFSIPAHLQPVLRRLALEYPTVPFLCHHMAGARANEPEPRPILRDILASAAVPNIHVKLSGFHYISPVPYAYPFDDSAHVVRALYEHFGPERLHWGSDYPVVRRALTHQQSLEAFRYHLAFAPNADRARIFGDSLFDLLEARA
jgi:predicted TIM-barrel fold metal-dependent hydrolase